MTTKKYYRILDRMNKKNMFTWYDVLKSCNGYYSEAERWIGEALAAGRVVRIAHGYRVNI